MSVVQLVSCFRGRERSMKQILDGVPPTAPADTVLSEVIPRTDYNKLVAEMEEIAARLEAANISLRRVDQKQIEILEDLQRDRDEAQANLAAVAKEFEVARVRLGMDLERFGFLIDKTGGTNDPR